jgi:NAD(P)-dependent dehydrogenase (short-subunit alcohol dehydrogenase family)
MLLDAEALAGRTVLVTGASGDIGRAITAAVGSAGANVIAHYGHRRDAAEKAVAAIPADRRSVVHGDLSTGAGARELWRAASAIGPIDAVVLNAAVITPTPMDGTDEQWDDGLASVLAVNVIGTGSLMREAVRTFADRGHGVVVTVSSWAAQQGSRILDVSGYAASKAAIRSLTQTFARLYARQGVRLHVVAPGVVDGGMGTAGLDDDRVQRLAEGLAMGQLVGVDEIAAMVAFLCADATPALSGATIDMNGASYVR